MRKTFLTTILLFVTLFSNMLTGQDLRQCDYLIISPQIFQSSSILWEQKLNSILTGRGFTPYIHYVSNNASAESIQDDIQTAYNDGVELKYVLLLGTGKTIYIEPFASLEPNVISYYTKEPSIVPLEGNPAMLNFIPFFLVDSKNLWTHSTRQKVASDDPYIDGLTGRGVVKIGRIPAENVQEVWTYSTKLERYYNTLNNNNYSEYRSKELLLTMDVDCPDNRCTAALVSEIQNDLKTNHLPEGIDLTEIMVSDPTNEFNEQNCPYLDYCRFREEKFEQKLNEGFGLISLSSTHGGPIKLAGWYWADQSSYNFTNTDVLPFLFGLTCNMGEVNHPTYPSVVKKLMLNTEGGIIGAIAPTGATEQHANQFVQNYLHDQLFIDGENVVGELNLLAKEAMRNSDFSHNEYYTNSLIVLGDPSLPIMLEEKESDNITGTETWNGVISINNNIKVEANATLNVEPGTHLKLFAGAILEVKGTLNLNGTTDKPIVIEFPNNSGYINVTEGGNITVDFTEFYNTNSAIHSNKANTVVIQNSLFNTNYGVYLYQNDIGTVTIENNTFNSETASIFLVSCFAPLIRGNTINLGDNGIILSDVTKPYIIENNIQNSTYGIHYYSSGGFIIGNNISNCDYGVYLYNSSPLLGSNEIHNNIRNGLYILNGTADLRRTVLSLPSGLNQVYPVSGFNKIYNNAGTITGCEGDEIFLNGSTISMYNGCNEVYDDRVPNPGQIETKMIIGGINFNSSTPIDAGFNYWGDNPHYQLLTERFHAYINYSPLGCLDMGAPKSGAKISLTGNSGNTVQEFESLGTFETSMPDELLAHKSADEKYYTGNLATANIEYTNVLSTYPNSDLAFFAASKLNEIGRTTENSNQILSNKNFFSQLSLEAQQENIQFMYEHLSVKNTIYLQKYADAISYFESIIEENSGNQTALCAEIDLLTTLYKAVIDGQQVAKSGKIYSKRDSYSIIEQMYKATAGDSKESGEETVNTLAIDNYELNQNYPNPFNPETVIEYSIPENSFVSIKIYNILGEEIHSLINENHKPGRYSIKFNAANLATGVYIYRLVANDFKISKKMLLLK